MIKRMIALLLGISMPFSLMSLNNSKDRFTVYGDYLYWNITQEGTQFAGVLPGGFQAILDAFTSGTGPTLEDSFTIIDPRFKWTSGFRVGAAYDLHCSNWAFEIAWTHFNQKITSRVTGPTDSIFPLAVPLPSIFGLIGATITLPNEADSQWKFDYNTVDLLVRKKFGCNGTLFSPFLGVKFAQINQTQHIEYFGFVLGTTPTSLQNKKNNHFSAVGPSVGFDLQWYFAPGWSLGGGVGTSLLCGKFKGTSEPGLSFLPSFVVIQADATKKTRLRPMADASIEINWETYFQNTYRFLVGVGYEGQYWWNQWQVPSSFLGSMVNGGNSPQGDLMMHGLKVKAGISF